MLMNISESIVKGHLQDEGWLHSNSSYILKSIRNFSVETINILSEYEDYQSYIVRHNLYSSDQKEKIINSSLDLSDAAFHNLCGLLEGKDIDKLYEIVKLDSLKSRRAKFTTYLWLSQVDYLIRDAKKTVELVFFSYENAGKKGMFYLMKMIIVKYPFLLKEWLSYDTATVVRFYGDIGKYVKFDDESIDILINSLDDNGLVNQDLLKEMLRSIMRRNHCSTQKKAEILFSLS